MTFGAVQQWSGCTKLEYSSNGPLVRERTAGTIAFTKHYGNLLAGCWPLINADKRRSKSKAFGVFESAFVSGQ